MLKATPIKLVKPFNVQEYAVSDGSGRTLVLNETMKNYVCGATDESMPVKPITLETLVAEARYWDLVNSQVHDRNL